MNKFKRIMKIIGKSILALVVIIIVSYSIAMFVFGRRVEAELAKIKAKGEPVSWADLNGPRIPDSENAAVIYEKIFKEYSDTSLSKGGYDMVSRTVVASYKSTLEDTGFWTNQRESNPALWNEVGQALAKQKPIIDQIEVAVSKPNYRFPVTKPDTVFPDPRMFKIGAKKRGITRLLYADALFNATEGNMPQALRSVDLGFKFNKYLNSEPFLISYLGRVACISITSRALQDVSQLGHINEAQARQLYDTLSGMEMQKSYLDSLKGERVLGISLLSGYRKALPRASLYIEESGYLDMMDRSIKAARFTYRESASRNLLVDKRKLPYFAFMSRNTGIADVLNKSLLKRDECIASVTGSQIFLALLAYKDKFDAYPRNLAELRAKLGWELKKDPFSGKDFIYRRQGKGFILYSLGTNMKDDGGLAPKDAPGPDRWYNSDRVWQMER